MAETVSVDTIPWSGYWWPHHEGALVTGNGYYSSPAPLEKYDLLVRAVYPSTLSRWYRNTYYDPKAPAWYGHCLAWSTAAMTEEYDILPSSENNIHFRIGDKKGLLTLAHNKDSYQLGDQTASTFHFWLLKYIKDQGRPFIADLDSTDEKWYYPVFKYDMQSRISGNIESVTLRIYYVNNLVSPDYLGSDIKTKDYTYDLELDDDGSILYGSWTGTSYNEHPHLLLFPFAQLSTAQGLDYNKARQIARSRDDFLENSNVPSALYPGRYNLVLMDEDNYTVPVSLDDIFSLQILRIPGSQEEINLVITDARGQSTFASITENHDSFTFKPSTQNKPPYTIQLSQGNYETAPNLYSIIVNQGKIFEQHLPYFPHFRSWRGFAITNDSDTTVENVMLTSRNERGEPVHTVWGPISLEPHQKKVFHFNSLAYRDHEFNSIDALTLQADSPVHFISLIGNTEAPLLAAQVQNKSYGTRIIIPLTQNSNSVYDMLFSFVANNSIEQNSVSIKVFESSGALHLQHQLELGPWEKVSIKPGMGELGNLPDNGWIELNSLDGLDISTYSYHQTTVKATGLFGLLPDTSPQYIPHVAESSHWNTTLTLINTSGVENTVTLHPMHAGSETSSDSTVTLAPYEKRILSIGEQFGYSPVNKHYRSVIEVTGTVEFCGFFSYRFDAMEEVAYPLLQSTDSNNILTMPHFPDSASWWTGIVIANTNKQDMQVTLTAFDKNGISLPEKHQLEIVAGSYKAHTVASIFGEVEAMEISYVSIESSDTGTNISGLYIYGAKQDNSNLSGSVMN